MSKPNKERITTHAAANLTHNPFAVLAVTGDLPLNSAPAEPPSEVLPLKLGRVVLRKETAHRGGKSVLVVDDFGAHLHTEFLEDLLKTIKKSCGCGGALKGRRIEIQGDQPAKIRALLEEEGFRVAGI